MRKLMNLSLDKNPRTINKKVIVLGFFISILICNGILVENLGIKGESQFQETNSIPPQSAATLSVSNTWDYDDPTGARDEPRSSSMVLNPSSPEEDGYFIGETSGAFYSHNRNSRILRYDTSGNVQWGATMSDGAIYAWSEVGSLPNQEAILAAQQYQGDFIRFQRYDSSGATSGSTWDYDPSENVWLSGMTSGDAIWVVGQQELAVKSLFLLKLDPSGSTTIATTWNNGSELWPAKAVADGMGGVYVTGMEVISSNHHLFLAHFDQNGDLVDHIIIAGIRDLYGNDIDFDGTYIHIIGGQEETTTDIYDLYVWTFDSSLILQNSQLIDGYETSRPSLFSIVEGHLFHTADFFIKVVDSTTHDFVFSALVPDGSMGQSRFFHMDYGTYSIDAGMNYDVTDSHDNEFHIERTWYGALFFIGHQWTAYGDHPIIRSLNMSFSFTVDTGMPYAYEDHPPTFSVSNTWDYDDPTGARDEPRSSSMVLNPSSPEEDGYFIGETSGAFYSNNRNSRILRYDTSGNVQWGATMSGEAIYAWSEVGSLPNQEAILAAQQYQGDFIRLQRYDSSGATSGSTWDYDPSENVWLSGMTSGDAIWVVGQQELAVKSLFLLKLDPSGSTIIAKTWNSGSELWPAKAVADGMGGVYVTGMEVISSNHHLFLAHFDQNGDLVDHITMAGIRDLYGNDIDFDGTYIHIIGGQEETTTDIYDLYVLTFDSSLILQNSQLIDGYEISRPSLFSIVEGHLFNHLEFFIKVVDANAHDFVFSATLPDGSMGQSRFFHMDYGTYSIDAGMNYDVTNSHDHQFHIERTWYASLFFIGHQWTAYGDHPIIRSLNMSYSFTVDTGMPYACEDHSTSVNESDDQNPIITNFPSDLTVKINYTEQSISWTATDLNPSTYTIELQGSGIVAGPTVWASGAEITYAIPDDLAVDVYVYSVTFMDDYGNSIDDSVTFTVEEDEKPSNGDDKNGVPGASFEYILILSIGTVAAIIMMKKKKTRSNLEW